MKIKAKLKGDVCEVKMQIPHDMMTYDQAEKKTGNRDDANFVTYVTGNVNGKVVFEMSSSQFLSKNPIIKYTFKGAKSGDELSMTWIDRKGNTETDSTKIK